MIRTFFSVYNQQIYQSRCPDFQVEKSLTQKNIWSRWCIEGVIFFLIFVTETLIIVKRGKKTWTFTTMVLLFKIVSLCCNSVKLLV